MEQKRSKSQSAFDLIKNEIKNFQHQHQHQNQLLGKNSWCAESSACAATSLVEKLMKIVENEEKFPASISPLETEIVAAQNQNQSQSSEQKAFSNSVVVRKILSSMDVRSLFKLREVNRLWREEATSALLSPRCETLVCVRFMVFRGSTEFTSNPSRPLSEFIEKCINNSDIFPCSQFIFNEGQLSEPTLTRFFSEFGHHVQHLTLSPESVDEKSLRNILFKWTPNLKSLVLNSRNWPAASFEQDENGPEPEVGQPLILSKLVKIRLPKTSPIPIQTSPGTSMIYEILTCAPNLTSIEDPSLTYVPQIVSAGKISLVKSVRWSVLQNSDGNLDGNFARFVRAQPKVKSVTFENVRFPLAPMFFPVIHALFVLSQNTLENLEEIQGIGHISDPSLKFPPLPKVTQLKLTPYQPIDSGDPPFQPILPQGHTLSQLLPSLKFLHFDVKHKISDFQFFSPNNAHAGVQKLEISNFRSARKLSVDSEWFTAMAWLYPNVTSLQITIYRDEDSMLDCLKFIPQSFKKLMQLTIKIRGKENIRDNFQVQMDKILTGLPPQIYENLLRCPTPDPEFQKPEVLAQLRTAPSILDLKDLTKLTFDIHFERESRHLWSHVAQFYAFQPMAKRQGLEVKVCGSERPSVQIKHGTLGPI